MAVGDRTRLYSDKVRHGTEGYVWSIRQAMREGVSCCLLACAAPTPVHLRHVLMVFARSATVCETNDPQRNSHASTPDLQLFNGPYYAYMLSDKPCNWHERWSDGVKVLLRALQ